MNAFKTVALVGAAAAALAIAGGANATATFTGNGSYSITNANGAIYDNSIPTGSFTDTITFSAPSKGTLDGDVTFLISQFDIASFTATLNGAAYDFSKVSKSEIGVLTAPALASNTLVISGTSLTPGAHYTANITFTPSAVPEPASWAMMIGGVGFVGGALRRKATRSTNAMVAA